MKTRVDRCTCVTTLCPCDKSPLARLPSGPPYLDAALESGRCLSLLRRPFTREPYLCPTCAWQAQAERSDAC